MNAKIICMDFDSTIHAYKGWRGEGYAVIEGEPLPGVKDAIKELRNSGCIVLIHSVRCSYTGGAVAIMEYCVKHNLRVDGVCTNKPPADVYVDDKAVTHRGDWAQTVKDIKSFVPWHEKVECHDFTTGYSDPIVTDMKTLFEHPWKWMKHRDPSHTCTNCGTTTCEPKVDASCWRPLIRMASPAEEGTMTPPPGAMPVPDDADTDTDHDASGVDVSPSVRSFVDAIVPPVVKDCANCGVARKGDCEKDCPDRHYRDWKPKAKE